MTKRIAVLLSASAIMSWAAEPVVEPAAPPAPPTWNYKGKLGAFLSDIGSTNAEDSRDNTINATSDSVSYKLTGDLVVEYRQGIHSMDHTVRGAFGKVRSQGDRWKENTDEAHYDGVYRASWAKPWFNYAGWAWDSVFTGPEPDSNRFAPGTYRFSTGLGQLFEGFQAEQSKAEWRLGMRGEHTYGEQPPGDTAPWFNTGGEFFARYERKHDARVSYFAQYEAWNNFLDMTHVKHLGQAGLLVQVFANVTAEFKLRVYYENAPEVYADDAKGYQQISMRRETLIGITYSF